jgi:3-hydroxyacyl-[acyl-carrier-protein] dehydratase
MDWCWIDRFVEFESGRYAQAVKSISLAEEHLHDHFPGYPMMPGSLVLEGLAQTGGLLVFEHVGFSQRVILAKIPRARFYGQALPGDVLIYTATLEFGNAAGAMVSATSHRGKRLQAEAEIMFAYVEDQVPRASRFDGQIFLKMLKTLGAFEVGRAADGSRLVEPPPIRAATRTAASPLPVDFTNQLETATKGIGSERS